MSESSFLILLGILILVSAVIVLYFESKIRDQNHKIASMFSLVTSLADETHQIKRVFQGHSYLGGTSSMNNYTNTTTNNSDVSDPCVHDLIEVSDDEDEEEDDSEEEEDEESNGENDDESEDDDDGIKVIKLLNISDTTYTQLNIDSELESENGDDTELDTLYVKQVLGLKYSDDEKEYEKEEEEEKKEEEKKEEEGDDKGTEEKGTEDKETEERKGAKHISIDLGENFPMDYKKMQLPKLRQVVVDKELASHVEASKLKKPELLKLLGEH